MSLWGCGSVDTFPPPALCGEGALAVGLEALAGLLAVPLRGEAGSRPGAALPAERPWHRRGAALWGGGELWEVRAASGVGKGAACAVEGTRGAACPLGVCGDRLGARRDRPRRGRAEGRQQQMLWETFGVHPQGLERRGFGGRVPTEGTKPRPGERGGQGGGGAGCGEGRCDRAAAQAHIVCNLLFVSTKVLAALINGCVIRVKVCRNGDSCTASRWPSLSAEGGAGHCGWPSLLCPHPALLQHQVPQPAAGKDCHGQRQVLGGFRPQDLPPYLLLKFR